MGNPRERKTASRGDTLVVTSADRPPVLWAREPATRTVTTALLDDEAATRAALEHAGCVLLDASEPGFVSIARRIHALDPAVQVVAVTPAESMAATRRALLYAPGLGEVWIASPAEVNSALEERAAGVTRQRRKFDRTRARVDYQRLAESPQRTERALVSDAYLAGLLVVLPDAVFSVDAAGRVLSANVAAERLFGAAPRLLVGERLSRVLGLSGAARDDIELLTRAAGESHLEVDFRTGPGDARVGELRATKMRVGANTEVWAVVLRDVTEQHETITNLRDTTGELEAANEELQTTTEELLTRTEEAEQAVRALRESENSFRALADAIPTLAWTARADGYIDWYNRQWYEYTGTTPEQMEGWGWQSVHDSAVLPAVMERWTASIESGRPFEMTFPLRGADGRFRAFLTRVVPLCDDAGRVIRWFGTNTDVEAERASRARVEQLQALTEALAATKTIDEVAAVVVPNALRSTGAGAGVLTVRSPSPDEAIVVGSSGLSRDALKEFERFPIDAPRPSAECMRSGVPIFVESRDGANGLYARFPALRKFWDTLDTQALAALPLVAGGATVGAMVFTFDRSRHFSSDDRAFYEAVARQCAQAVERARLFAAEREARAHADEANRAKSQFLATMSHELRTPLNAIAGYVQLMDMGIHGAVTSEQHEVLARVNAAQAHLLGLINDVLNFAKLESGRVEYDVATLAVADVFKDVAPLIAPQFAQRDIRFDIALPHEAESPLVVLADRDKARQVLLNLLSNAAKFTSAGGEVHLTAERRGADQVAMQVRDTGRGIPADRLQSIFEPFVQVRAAYNAVHEGTGLGLAISRDLARGMGGDLTVESREHKGSTFTLLLPSGRKARG